MASLAQKVKQQEAKRINVSPVVSPTNEELTPLKLERESSMFADIDFDRAPDIKEEGFHNPNILFISDTKLTDDIKKTIYRSYQSIQQYDHVHFHNRTLNDLRLKGVKHIWLNIKESNEVRVWSSINLRKHREGWFIIAIHKAKLSSASGWIDKVQPNLSLELKQLNKIESLNFKDLLEQVDDLADLLPKVKKSFMSCIGLSKGKKKMVRR